MKKTALVIFSLVVFLFPYVIKADDLTQKIDKLVNDYTALGTFSGTVLVAKDGNVIYEKASGMEDREANKPLTMSSRFNIGSMGKTFTAVAIMQYVEQGKLSLDSKLSEMLPEYAFANADKITLAQILSHTAGLSNYMTHPDFDKRTKEYTTIDQFLTLALEVPPVGAPGEKFAYSNTGFVVLGKIIEKLSGKNYFDYIKEKIWQPLEMNNTTVYSVNTRAENKAAGYDLLPNGEKIYQGAFDIPALSDGGAFSNVYDLLKYANALKGNTLLKDETKKEMFTKRANFGPITGYGYGFMIYTDKGENVAGHGGDCPGYSSDLNMMFDKGYTIIILSNYQGLSRGLSVRLMDLVNGKEYPAPKKPVTFVIYDLLKEKGVKYLSENSENLNASLKEKGYDALNDDGLLNNLGYTLLFNVSMEEATDLFTINAQLFPDVPNVWDSLAESYMKRGDNEKAVVYYKKVLELDKANENAKKMIAKLQK